MDPRVQSEEKRAGPVLVGSARIVASLIGGMPEGGRIDSFVELTTAPTPKCVDSLSVLHRSPNDELVWDSGMS